MKTRDEYTRELHKAIESLSKGNKSDADLLLTNFYFSRGPRREDIYVSILGWTLTDAEYRQATSAIQARVADILYNLVFNTNVNKRTNEVFVKRTKDGYAIERKS